MSDKKKMSDLASQDDYRPLELSIAHPDYAAPRPRIGGILNVPIDDRSSLEARGSYMQQPYEQPEWKAMLGYRRRF